MVPVIKQIVRLNAKETYEALQSSPSGLTSEEAARRLAEHGSNTLVEKKPVPVAYRFLTHLKDLFGILLLFASMLAALGGMVGLSVIILAVVLVNTFFSLFQEWRAEKAMETLKNWMPEYAKVIRDGEMEKVLVREIVTGDLIVMEEGDRVPADARLVEAYDLWTNNVPLTGESEPQPRTWKPANTIGASDRKSVV